MHSEDLNMLCIDANSSDRGQESGSDRNSTDFSVDFSANEPSTSKTVAQHMVFYVHKVLEEVLEQSHGSIENIHPINSKLGYLRSVAIVQKTLCSRRQVAAM